MNFDHDTLCRTHGRMLDRVRRSLPIPVYARPERFSFLRLHRVGGRGAPRLSVIGIFDAGEERGLMCRFLVANRGARQFVAPLAKVALDRRHPIARVLAAQRRDAAG